MTTTIGKLDTLADEIFSKTNELSCENVDSGIKFDLFETQMSVWVKGSPAYYCHKEYGQIDLDVDLVDTVHKVLAHIANKLK